MLTDRPLIFSPDAFYLPTNDGGVLFQTHEGSFTIDGHQAYALIERLAALLTGTHSADEIVKDLPRRQEAAVRRVIQQLWSRGALGYSLPPPTSPGDAALLERFGQHIRYIERMCGDGFRRFADYQRRHVFCAGRGGPLAHAVAALFDSGITKITVDPRDLRRHDEERLARVSASYGSYDGGPRQVLSFDPLLPGTHPDALVYVTDDLDVDHLLTAMRRCIADGVLFLPVVLHQGFGYCGPLVGSRRGPCWECAWRRRAREPQPSRAEPTRLLESLLGHNAAFTIFGHLVGIPTSEPAGQLLTIAPETYDAASHALTPHPLCRSCEPPPVETIAVADEDVHLARLSAAVDAKFGVIRQLEGGDLSQYEVSQRVVVAGDPRGLVDSEALRPIRVVGVDASAVSAEAVRAALQAHLEKLAMQHLHAVQEPPIGAVAVPAAHGTGETARWLPALRVPGDAPVWIVAPTSLPAPAAGRGYGIGSGRTRPEALVRAFIDAVLQETAADPARERWVLVDEPGRTAASRHYLATLRRRERVESVWISEGRAGWPVAGIRQEAGWVAFGCHCDVDLAIQVALANRVAAVLADDEQHPVGALPLPHDHDWEPWLRSLALQLPATGHAGYSVDLDPRGHLRGLFPHVVAFICGKVS